MSINLKEAEKLYKNSIKILKEAQLENGGCLATPEGERYPYIYPRDHSFCILGFLSAGLKNNAKKGLEFILKEEGATGAFPQRYDKKGRDASYKPVQIDGTGLILYAFARYVQQTKDFNFARKYWKRVQKAAQYIISNIYLNDRVGVENLVYTPNSIHEFPPTEAGLEIWANCACYAALKELSQLAKKINLEHNKWEEYSSEIRASILKYMWNPWKRSFIKNIRIKESSSVKVEPDISQYAVAYFGVLPEDDYRIKLTVKRIEENLWNEDLGGICRYPKQEGRHNGGFGPWPHFTLMICRHYINLGDIEKVIEYLNWILEFSYDYELPEHISTVEEFEEYVTDFKEAGILREDRLILINNARKHPMFEKGLAYISLPLCWPHAEFILTWNLYKKKFFDNK